jgi:hypothetical protein
MEPAAQNCDQATGTGTLEVYATGVDPPVGHYGRAETLHRRWTLGEQRLRG